MDKEDLLIGAAIVAILAFLIYAAVQEQREWNAFAAAHDCKVVGKERGHANVGYGVTANGQLGTVVTTTPSKTGYLCDDGITYWR